jgi:hypothetical protein
MANKGLQFEWCIYHLIAVKSHMAQTAETKHAASEYSASPADVKKDAASAVAAVEKAYGAVGGVEKTSGGGKEPKTDLYISAGRSKLKCSLKYGGSIQLSSAGVNTTVEFISGILKAYTKSTGRDVAKCKRILKSLAEFEDEYGDLGKIAQNKATQKLIEAKKFNLELQSILGSRTEPDVASENERIKLAIVEEAITGKYTFGATSKLSADHILTETEIKKVDAKLIREVAHKTSVRLALKGRGKKVVGGREVRLNEIVVRFDTA